MKAKQITQKELHDTIGKKPMYFYYEFEDAVIRSEFNGKTVDYHVKFKGEREFKAMKGSNVVTQALMTPATITKEDYDNF